MPESFVRLNLNSKLHLMTGRISKTKIVKDLNRSPDFWNPALDVHFNIIKIVYHGILPE